MKGSAIAADGELWVAKVVALCRILDSDSKHVSLANELEDEEKEVLLKAFEQLSQFEKVTDDYKDASRGAELLTLSLILLQYCGEGQDLQAFQVRLKLLVSPSNAVN